MTTSMTWLAKLRELQEKGDLYMVAKKLAGKFLSIDKSVKDNNSNHLVTTGTALKKKQQSASNNRNSFKKETATS